jgi:hypothetical protein
MGEFSVERVPEHAPPTPWWLAGPRLSLAPHAERLDAINTAGPLGQALQRSRIGGGTRLQRDDPVDPFHETRGG